MLVVGLVLIPTAVISANAIVKIQSKYLIRMLPLMLKGLLHLTYFTARTM